MAIQEDNDKTYYHTDNKHILSIDLEIARPVDLKRAKKLWYLYALASQKSWILSFVWMKEEAEVEGNPQLTRMRRAVQGIFNPLSRRACSAVEEVQVQVVEPRVLEKKREGILLHIWKALGKEGAGCKQWTVYREKKNRHSYNHCL